MKKLICALAALLPLSGCWWNDAPETYKGVATLTFDNGDAVTRDFACDFRGQQAKRICSFAVSFRDERYAVKVPEWECGYKSPSYKDACDSMRIMQQPDFDAAQKRIAGLYDSALNNRSIIVRIDAHARKEDRYLVFISSELPWYRVSNPTVPTDNGEMAYLANSTQLDEGVSHELKVDKLEFFLSRVIKKIELDNKGDMSFDPLAAPMKATLKIRWEPVPANSLTS